MLTITRTNKAINGKEVADMVCLSSDTKPDGFSNGSICLEMDTGDFYYFDGDNEEWAKIGG